MLRQMRTLKKLNIANNQGLSSGSIADIVNSMKSMTELLDIDLSKLNCNSL